MLTLDGSTLEGGGQLTRMALCLSALISKPLKIHNIRAGRGTRSSRPVSEQGKSGSGRVEKSRHSRQGDRKDSRTPNTAASTAKTGGGLKESHLAALYWLAEKCYADVDGDQVGSCDVLFKPGKRPWKDQVDHLPITDTIELQKPGSVWLIFQAIFPFMVFGPRPILKGTNMQDLSTPIYDITLKGGTDVPKSMTTEYVQQVFLPICMKIGLPRTEIEVVKRGWTTGKIEIGQVRIKVYPSKLQPPSTVSNTTIPEIDHESANTISTPQTTAPAPFQPSAITTNEHHNTPPFTLPPFTITSRGSISSISLTLLTSSPPTRNKLSTLLTTTLQTHPTFQSLNPQPAVSTHPSLFPTTGDPRRLYILLTAHTSNGWILGRDYLSHGAQAKNARQEDLMLEKAVGSVVRDLMNEIERGGCVDEYMADQLVVFQALAEGESVVNAGTQEEVGQQRKGDQMGSLHARTVRWVCEEILGRYGVRFETEGRCCGIGWNSKTCRAKDDDGLEGIDEE